MAGGQGKGWGALQDEGSGELGQQELGSVGHGRGKKQIGALCECSCAYVCGWVCASVCHILLMEATWLLVLKQYETCSRNAMSTNPLQASRLGSFLPVGPWEFTPGLWLCSQRCRSFAGGIGD